MLLKVAVSSLSEFNIGVQEDFLDLKVRKVLTRLVVSQSPTLLVLEKY